MNLLEILVRELPKRGGWPHGSDRAMQTDDGWIRFPDIGEHCDFLANSTANRKRIATLDEYEAALAEVEPEWNGEGLPPVGCECEIKRIADWMPVTIKFISTYHTVFTTFGGTEDCYQTCSLQFRPIRSDADRKRDDSINVIADLCRSSASNGHSAELIYDAIAAGKIPHLKIV